MALTRQFIFTKYYGRLEGRKTFGPRIGGMEIRLTLAFRTARRYSRHKGPCFVNVHQYNVSYGSPVPLFPTDGLLVRQVSIISDHFILRVTLTFPRYHCTPMNQANRNRLDRTILFERVLKQPAVPKDINIPEFFFALCVDNSVPFVHSNSKYRILRAKGFDIQIVVTRYHVCFESC